MAFLAIKKDAAKSKTSISTQSGHSEKHIPIK